MPLNFTQLLQPGPSTDGVIQASRATSEEDQWIDVLQRLSAVPGPRDRWAGFAAGILVATDSNRIRNAAALALADMGAQDAGGSIVEVLRRPGVGRAAGTLLYALEELGASLPLGVLVGLIENGSYEARAMALHFVEDGRIGPLGDAEVDDARRRLARLAGEAGDPEGAEAAQLVLSYLGSAEEAA